jgi:hypothetical protein
MADIGHSYNVSHSTISRSKRLPVVGQVCPNRTESCSLSTRTKSDNTRRMYCELCWV